MGTAPHQSRRKLRVPVVGEEWIDLDIGRGYYVPDGLAEEAKAAQGRSHRVTTIPRVVTIVAVFPKFGRVSVRSNHTNRVTDVQVGAFHDHDSADIRGPLPRRGMMRKDHHDARTA